MPTGGVVVNEFEVVPEPAAGTAPGAAPAPAAGAKPAIEQEIARVLRREAERARRVRAY